MANAREIGRQMMADLKRDYGLSDAQAAGVVGNLMHESANFGSMQEVQPQSGRGGYGYAQWTGSRRNSFEDYVRSRDLEPSSYEANYGFLRHEIENDRYERGNFNQVRRASTPAEAARIFSDEYLRPNAALSHNDRRIRNANAAMELRSGPPGQPAPRPTNRDTAVGAINRAVGTPQNPSMAYAPIPIRSPVATPRSAPPTVARGRNAGDSIALAPVQGGRPVAPSFDATYNPRVGGATLGTGTQWGMSRVPALPTRTAQTYAGQERTPNAPRTQARLPELASPGTPRRNIAQSYAGQDRAPAARNGAPRPATQSTDLAVRRAPGTTVASIPTRTRARLPDLPASTLNVTAELNRVTPRTPPWAMTGMNQSNGVGASPETRTVQAVPVSPAPRTAQTRSGPMTMADARRLYADTDTQYRSPGPAMTVQQMYAGIGSQPLTNTANLLPGAPSPVNPMQQSEQLLAARMGRPIPLPRPNFGVGGPGFQPVNAAAIAQANRVMPMPLSMRPAPMQRQPLNVLVQGSRTIRQPAVQPAVQPARLTPAQAQAIMRAQQQSNRGGFNPFADRTRDRDGGNSGLSSI